MTLLDFAVNILAFFIVIAAFLTAVFVIFCVLMFCAEIWVRREK